LTIELRASAQLSRPDTQAQAWPRNFQDLTPIR
jgi:hypothetical protein